MSRVSITRYEELKCRVGIIVCRAASSQSGFARSAENRYERYRTQANKKMTSTWRYVPRKTKTHKRIAASGTAMYLFTPKRSMEAATPEKPATTIATSPTTTLYIPQILHYNHRP